MALSNGRMAGRTRAARLIAIGVAVGLCAVPAAASGRQPTCQARQTVAKTSKVIVYVKPTRVHDSGYNSFESGVYACWRANGRSSLVGYWDLDGGNEPDHTLVRKVVSGRYVAALFLIGFGKYHECFRTPADPAPPPIPNCPLPKYRISVVDARDGRSVSFLVQVQDVDPADGSATPRIGLSVSSAGGLAWTDARGLLATRLLPAANKNKLRTSPKVLDASAAGLVSVTGLTVTWYDNVNGARVNHTATLS
jgi:hypothetical protein